MIAASVSKETADKEVNMLVLTRKEGESIVVLGEGDKPVCRIVVVKMQGNKVKIGVEADGGLDILREELLDEEEKA